MGRIIQPEPIEPGDVDFSWMVGRAITAVTFSEPTWWTFSFGREASISLESPWRILARGRIACSSEDHQQQYGLPAVIDAAADAARLLAPVVVSRVEPLAASADLLISFSAHLRLEILPISSGYEAWQISDPFGRSFVAQGGGQICTWNT
jgi:hypothetical protein